LASQAAPVARGSAFGIGQHGINLDVRTSRQAGYTDNATGRCGAGEVIPIHRIHQRQVGQPGQADIHFHHIRQAVLNALCNVLQVFQTLAGLRGNATSHYLAVMGANGQQGGNVVVVREGNRLRGQLVLRHVRAAAGTDDNTVAVLHCLRRGAVAMRYHGFNLDTGCQRQRLCRNHAAGREIGMAAGNGGIWEESAVNSVHCGQVGQIDQVQVDFDNVVKRHVNAVQNGLDIAQALGGLLLDATFHQHAGMRVDR